MPVCFNYPNSVVKANILKKEQSYVKTGYLLQQRTKLF